MSTHDDLARRAGSVTVGALVRKQARLRPDRIAVEWRGRTWTYGDFNRRANRLANALADRGVRRGDRVAFLSHNHPAYLELLVAAAKLGAVVASLNWRLADPELEYCIGLTTPVAALVGRDRRERLDRIAHGLRDIVTIEDDLEALIASGAEVEPPDVADAEDGLVILYTSGTTGHPKAAVISQRAEIARLQASVADWDWKPEDTFVAWSPFFHMSSIDPSLGALMVGSKVVVLDGPDVEAMLAVVARDQVNRLVLFPGMIGELIDRLRAVPPTVKHIRTMGVIPDLVPAHQIAEITRLLGAPYNNTFGSTECGPAPASGNRIPIGVVPEHLGKLETSFCDVRLVDERGNDVADGSDGECVVRGPMLFSGYWGADDVNAREFRGGWFHTGDVFRRRPDGLLDFVDRIKYLIKTGGENVYPAEIERVVKGDPRVVEAVVVRRPDERWGEVPVLLVAVSDPAVTAEDLVGRCRAELAGYKRPKAVIFVEEADFVRSTTGKVVRHEMEAWVARRRPLAAD